MYTGDELLSALQGRATADCEAAHPHLWLLRERTEVPASHFRTTPWEPRALERVLGQGGEHPRMLGRFRLQPARFELWPVAKRGTNPWADRIFVGRAQNNDIVLPGDSISKQHAYFLVQPDGRLCLHDADSTNGTRADGVAVRGDAPAIVGAGASLVFGTLSCELVRTAELCEHRS